MSAISVVGFFFGGAFAGATFGGLTLIMLVESLFCLAIIVGSLDYLRAVMFWDKPAESISFMMLAAGAFWLLMDIAQGYSPNIGGVITHGGIVLFAATRIPELVRHYASSAKA
jgi:hypothetical protein